MNVTPKKQQVQWALTQMGADVALLTETKLTAPCIFHGFFSHQTLNIRKGGCLTLAS